MPQQVQDRPFAGPILRVRRLSGDKLSVTPAEKMKKSIDESKSKFSSTYINSIK